MTDRLKEFREQYPQYADWSDEELAEGLRQRYYQDMEPAEYRRQVGLPPLTQPEREKKPTFTQRVNSRLDEASRELHDMLKGPDQEAFDLRSFLLPDDEEPPVDQATPPLLRDQFFAGWDKYRANRANASAFSTIEELADVPAVARGDVAGRDRGGFLGVSGAQITKQARAAAADAGDVDAQRKIAQEIDSSRAELRDTLQALIDKRAELEYRQAQIPFSESTQRVIEADSFGGSVAATLDDPVRVIAELSIRSAPNMADAIPLAVAGALAGPYGFAAGMGIGSGMAEYRNAFAEALSREGVDLEGADSMLRAAEDPALMTRARNYAKTRSAIIGSFDAISGGIATRQLTPFVKNAVAREIANVAAQTGVQATLGAAGEASAQVATGEELQPGEIVAEALGEGGTAIIDVGLASVSGTRAYIAEEKARLIEAELNDFFGGAFEGDVPRGTDDGPDETGGAGGETIDPDQGTLPPPEPEPTPEPEPAPETPERERVSRDGGDFEVQFDNEYESGKRDVTVIAPDGRQTQLTLQPGETAEDAVKLVDQGEGDDLGIDPMVQARAEIAQVQEARRLLDEIPEDAAVELRNQAIGELNETIKRAREAVAQLDDEDQRRDFDDEIDRARGIDPDHEDVPDTPQPEVRNWFDPRLKRSTYRGHLSQLAGDLTPNGGVTYIFDEHQNIIGRTGSVNPPWFQDMNTDPATRMSVRRVQKAVDKALIGETLGVREKRVIDRMLGEIQDRRDQDVDAARADLERARELRGQARQNAGLEGGGEPVITAGEYYTEDEYPADMTAEARVIFELMEQAHQAGISEDQLERFAVQYERDADLIQALEEAINEQEQQAGDAPVPTQPETEPAPGAAQSTDAERASPDHPGRDFDGTGPQVQVGDQVDGLTVIEPDVDDVIVVSEDRDGIVLPGIQDIYLERIDTGPTLMDDASEAPGIERLAREITASGRIRPVVVIANGGEFVLEEGIHRIEALRLMGKDRIPAVVGIFRDPDLVDDGDLFGQDTSREQAIADEIRRRDTARNQGQDSLETGDPGDLFSQARQQTDIEDQGPSIDESLERALEAEPAALPEPAEPIKRKKLTKIQEATLAAAKRQPQPFNVNDLLGQDRPGTGKVGEAGQAVNAGTISVSNVQGLIDKGYLELVEERGHLDWILRVPDDLRVEEAPEGYNIPGYGEDITRYATSQPVESQAGAPRLERAKAAALDALRDLRSTPAVLPQSFARDLAANQRATLVGREINDPLDLAAAAQIYRDPRFETLRYFFVNDDGEIVAQLGTTSRLPASVEGFIGDSPAIFVAELMERAKAEGATGFWLLHNHPSGESNPSRADERLTTAMATDGRLHGLALRGHVVIDRDNWSHIRPDGLVEKHSDADFGAMDFEPSGGIAGTKIGGPTDILNVFDRQNEIPSDVVVLATANNRHQLRGLTAIHIDQVIGKNKAEVRRVIYRAALAERASRLFAVGRNWDALTALDGLVVDALAIDDEGFAHSLANKQAISANQDPWEGVPRPRVRVAAATSEAFDYLRPVAVRARRARGVPGVSQNQISAARRRLEDNNNALLQVQMDLFTLNAGRTPTNVDWSPFEVDLSTEAGRDELAGHMRETIDQLHASIEKARADLAEIVEHAITQRRAGEPSSRQDLLEEIVGLQEDLRNLDEGREPETFKTMIFEIDDTTPADVDQVRGQIVDRISELNQQLQASEYQVQESRDERRVDPKLRARISKMSIEELIDELYTDPLTGLANRRAFEEDHRDHDWLASIDVDSLKWVNDNLGPDAGDALLVAVGEALDQSGISAYHISGDEYYLAGDSREELEAALQLAAAVLGQQTVSSPRGSMQGINITWGLGQSKAIADADMKGQKKWREQAGKRAGREQAPPNITLSVKGQTIDMGPGSNYVGMIGQRGELPINANHEYVLGNGRIVRIPKKPIRREHILALMQRRFGNRIYQGRVKGKMRLGFYRPGHGEIRIKHANDIEVAAHEVAHWLDDRYPWIERLYKSSKAIQQEVQSVSYDVEKVFEGYAEFMRLFFTQDHEAMARAPGFYEAWTRALEDHPKLRDLVYDLQELMHAWTQQGARARLASKHGSAPPSIRERMRLAIPREGLIQSALDGLRSIKLAELDIGDDGTYRAYEKLRLALGGSNGVLEALMFHGTPGHREDDQGLEFTGDGLIQIFGDLWGDPDMALYMLARRGQELMGQGRENLLRPDEIAAGLSIAEEKPEVVEAFEGWLELNARMLDFFEQSGILGPATRALIEMANQNYVPFNRVIESEIEGRKVRQGGNPWQRLTGGTSNVNVVWENIINNYGWLIRLALVNDGKREFYNKILKTQRSLRGRGGGNQQAGLWAAPIGKDTRAVRIQSEQVLKKAVESMGWTMKQYKMAKEGFVDSDQDLVIVEMIDRMAEGLGEMTTFFLLGQDPKGYVDAFMHRGKTRWFEIGDPGLWDSIQYLGPKGTNLVLRILGGFTSALRRGVVSVPVFQAKNFIRDTTNAWLLTDHIKVPAVSALRVVFSRMMEDPDYQEMLLNGGGFANRLQGLQTHWRNVIDPSRVVAMYDRFMSRFENANRLAEYKAARAAGKTPRRAAFLSREISTDFAMRGSSQAARVLAIAVPFLNARAQGNYRVGRQLTERERALSYALRGSALMVATLALYALNKDDERYKELPEYIKDLNWVFFTGPGEDEYFLVPKPFESGMVWGTIPERMFELTETRDGKEFADALGWMFLQTFNMDMTPQLFAPWRDLSRNQDFTGSPIVPFYLDNVAPSEQYSYYTSETMRLAGEALDMSPIKMQHVFEGYLGTLGTYVLGMSDAIVRSTVDLETGDEPTRGETWRENILVRAIADPLISEGPPRRTKYVTDFYELMREAEQVAKTAALLEKRHSDKLAAYLEDPENAVNYAIYPVLTSIRSELNEIRRAMDLVRQDPDMPGDVKRGELWDMTRQRNRLLREAVTQVEEAKRREEMELMEQQRRASGAQ